MFFPEKIKSISKKDKVLEVGPGSSPHPRSDVLLEKTFNEEEAYEQRGHTKALKTDKKIVFYSGNKFPFEDNEFDYVICSHVLEHIDESEIETFIGELERVAKSGYIEYPTIYYEYLYNFKVHITFLNYKNNVIYYMSKNKSTLNEFFSIQNFFYKTLETGYDEVIRNNREYFFQGFEWNKVVNIQKTTDISDFISKDIKLKKRINYFNKLNNIKQLIRRLFK